MTPNLRLEALLSIINNLLFFILKLFVNYHRFKVKYNTVYKCIFFVLCTVMYCTVQYSTVHTVQYSVLHLFQDKDALQNHQPNNNIAATSFQVNNKRTTSDKKNIRRSNVDSHFVLSLGGKANNSPIHRNRCDLL